MTPLDPGNGDYSDVPKESSRSILFQFVFFPLGIVVVAVGIFLLFGKLASSEQTIPDYLNEIRSGSAHQRWQAAYQLSKSLKRGEAKNYPNLVDQVSALYSSSKDDDPRIRRYLSMVLGNLGDRKATPLLLDGLDDQDIETRIYVLLALGELRDPAAVPRIMQLASDDEKDVRKTAVYALGEIGDPRAVPVLVSALEDQAADVGFNAALALARFKDPRALPVLRAMLDRSRLNRVEGMREDQKEEAILAALGAYMRLAGRDALPELQRLAQSDPSIRVRGTATAAIQQLR
jgi:HEAT repeat protein